MFSPAIVKQQITLKKLNLKQDLFCKIFATDPAILGNASHAYMKAYGGSYLVATSAGKRLLEKPEITAKIQEYLSNEGFNDISIDKKHNFLVHQNKDLNVSLKAIQEYNKLKKRIDNKIELVLPKPLMQLDDDEVIHKIDKSKAKEVSHDMNT